MMNLVDVFWIGFAHYHQLSAEASPASWFWTAMQSISSPAFNRDGRLKEWVDCEDPQQMWVLVVSENHKRKDAGLGYLEGLEAECEDPVIAARMALIMAYEAYVRPILDRVKLLHEKAPGDYA